MSFQQPNKTFYCAICDRAIRDEDIDEHIASRHDSSEKRDREVQGTAAQLTDAEYVKMRAFEQVQRGDDDDIVQQYIVPRRDPLTEFGVRMQDIPAAKSTVVGGGRCSKGEVNAAITAMDKLLEMQIDRAAFVVNFLEWGFLNSFTEELEEAGGFTLISAQHLERKEEFYPVSELHTAISAEIAARFSGRGFTFRRLARYFGSQIETIVAKNEHLSAFKVDGTPVSNHLGIPPQLFMVASSIFPDIKPYAKWSAQEKEAYDTVLANATKYARQSEGGTRSLRPNPENARLATRALVDDFSRNHPGLARSSGLSGVTAKDEDELASRVRPWEELRTRFRPATDL